MGREDRHREPAISALSHPLVWGAAALVLLNDAVLAGRAPGWLTGKLADVGWLVLAPVALAAGLASIGVVGRFGQYFSISFACAFYSALQLWPPLGEWFSPAHVADAGDLWVLPALAGAVWVWTHPRPVRTGAVPVGATLVVGTLLADQFEESRPSTLPCPESGEWLATRPLRVELAGLTAPVGADAFLRHVRLLDEEGEEQALVAAEVAPGRAAMCARDGLKTRRRYTWILGPWDDPSSNEVGLTHPAFPTVEFVTIGQDGPGPVDAARCAELAAAFPADAGAEAVCAPGPDAATDASGD